MRAIITHCPKCESEDLEFEEKSVGCRNCMEVIYVEEDEDEDSKLPVE